VLKHGIPVAIVGKTNVGKSTLLNQLLKEKVSITASKPQTSPTTTGFDPFPSRGVIVTNDLINRLRDAEGI
jgi:GTP-binding protein Era